MPTTPSVTLQALSSRRRQVIERFLDHLTEQFGAQLLAVALVGPALDDPASARIPDTVVVLAGDDLGKLRQFSRLGRGLARDGVSAPLVLTPELIATSLDTFPLEFIDMQARHRLVHGQDFLSSLQFAAADVRLQCERDLKTAAMSMRQRTLHDQDRRSWPAQDIAEHTVRVLRGYLHMHRFRCDGSTQDVVAVASTQLGMALPAVMAAHGGAASWEDFLSLFREVTALGAATNGW
jgi:hypothetical protein